MEIEFNGQKWEGFDGDDDTAPSEGYYAVIKTDEDMSYWSGVIHWNGVRYDNVLYVTFIFRTPFATAEQAEHFAEETTDYLFDIGY